MENKLETYRKLKKGATDTEDTYVIERKKFDAATGAEVQPEIIATNFTQIEAQITRFKAEIKKLEDMQEALLAL